MRLSLMPLTVPLVWSPGFGSALSICHDRVHPGISVEPIILPLGPVPGTKLILPWGR